MEDGERKYRRNDSVDRENAMPPSKVEGFEVARWIPCIEKDSPNQESRKHEEQIHSAPSELSRFQENCERFYAGFQAKNCVTHENQQNGDSA